MIYYPVEWANGITDKEESQAAQKMIDAAPDLLKALNDAVFDQKVLLSSFDKQRLKTDAFYASMKRTLQKRIKKSESAIKRATE